MSQNWQTSGVSYREMSLFGPEGAVLSAQAEGLGTGIVTRSRT